MSPFGQISSFVPRTREVTAALQLMQSMKWLSIGYLIVVVLVMCSGQALEMFQHLNSNSQITSV
uniref:Vesicle transport protein n=1 Tax=Heterorhabditis bacteriophora TaxID=37862 RepID=A0A1I7X639_HETBA